MKKINLSEWDRYEYYEFFRNKSTQYLSVSFESDITALYQHSKEQRCSLYFFTIWKLLNIANKYLPLRQRIEYDDEHKECIVEHDKINALFTVPAANGYFNYCFSEYLPDFSAFGAQSRYQAEAAERYERFASTIPERNDIIFFSGVPTMSFTAIGNFQIPNNYNELPATIPMFMWGRAVVKNGRRYMPVNLVVNHIFCDGRHIGEIQRMLQREFNKPL